MQQSELVQLYPLSDGALIVIHACTPFSELLTAFVSLLQEERSTLQGTNLIIDTGEQDLTSRQLLELEDAINEHLGVRVLQMVQGEAAEILREEFGLQRAESTNSVTVDADVAPWLPLDQMDACLVRRTLRSGQRVSFEGSIVILGDINPGAEVVAGGDVVVFGTLRGVAHAGVRGCTKARIIALKLAATQLRIANYIGRAPDETNSALTTPEVAYVNDGRIMVDRMTWRAETMNG